MQMQNTLPALESAVYGSLAHAVEVLIDATSADGAVARVLGAPPIPGCVYIGSRGLARTQQVRRELRAWPTDPRSPFKHYQEKTRLESAWLLNARSLEDQRACQEITRAFAVPQPISGALCLKMDIEEQMWCMAVLVRGAEHQPFHDVDVECVKGLAPAAGDIIKKGFISQLRGGGPAQSQGIGPISANILLERLSKTEWGVLERLLERNTERQIAQSIGRSPHTIHVHVKSIYRKLMVSSRKQLLDMLDGLPSNERRPIDNVPKLAA